MRPGERPSSMRVHQRAIALAALLAAALPAACSGESSPRTPPDKSQPVDLRAISLTATQLHDLASADDAFGAELFRAVADAGKGNVVMSPASVALALQMAFAGARGDTATEMAEALQVGDVAPTDVAAAAARFLRDLAPLANGKETLLSLVNQVWVQDDFPLTTSYRTAMSSGFGAAFRRADFRADAEGARQDINDAVAAATHDKIPDLIGPGVLNDLTRLVLTNAVYLRARWAAEFSPDATEPRAFHLSGDETVDVPTMQQQDEFRYVRGEGYQAVVLPYVDGRLAMTVLVPDGDVAPLEHLLADKGVSALTGAAKLTPLTIALPRFRFTWSDDLSHPLAALGMPTAFTDRADFTGISTAEPLMIQFVLHKAFVAVDEEGTEAAAATAVGVGATSAMVPPKKPIVVRADHPFLFAITDTKTGLPLFLGRVSDPR